MDKTEVRNKINYYKRQLQAEWVMRNRYQEYSEPWEKHERNCFKFLRVIDDLMSSIGEYEAEWEKHLYTSM